MKVKELKKLLKKFDDDDTVKIEQEYNSNGGMTDIIDMVQSKYENKTVIIEGEFW